MRFSPRHHRRQFSLGSWLSPPQQNRVNLSEFASAQGRHRQRLRTCSGTACNRLFFDTTRNGKRLYCDSRTCGNRIHAARYRVRSAERLQLES
ncbi:CGNR zinc finger domain-containing protein [Mesorhizobium sp.]|uniref:CGNR zinc finger domain-containing protein n=1 Tax=Mesorhizobium sp. TaxID=1871066 RepID=UPI00356AEB6B